MTIQLKPFTPFQGTVQGQALNPPSLSDRSETDEDASISEEDTWTDLDGFIVSDDHFSSEEEAPESPAADEPSLIEPTHKRKAALDALARVQSAKKQRTIPLSRSKGASSNLSTQSFRNHRRAEEITNLSALFRQKGSFNIVGRDNTVQQIIRLVVQQHGRRPLLLGPANVGKKAIIKKTAEALATTEAGGKLCEKSIVQVDCQAVAGNWIASEEQVDIAEVARKRIAKVLREVPNPIIFFRNIDAFLENENACAYMNSFLTLPHNIIASISTKGKGVDGSVKTLEAHNFKVIQVGECPKGDVAEIVKQQIEKYPLPHEKMVLSEEALETAVNLADRHIKNPPFPMKALNLIREAAAQLSSCDDSKSKLAANDQLVITPEDIAAIVSEESGIPTQDLLRKSWDNIQRLEENLKKKIVGQNQAVETVVKKVKIHRMGIKLTNKPPGIFLFVGPTGVGKTLLAEELARQIFPDGKGLVKIKMEGYPEIGSLSKLIGTSAGYVGYGSAGTLDGPLKRRPESVILLDEIEKAGPEIINFFLGVFQDGEFTNGAGEIINCRDSIFICTSNVGAKELLSQYGKKRNSRKECTIDEKEVMQCIDTPLRDSFSAEFLNRVQVIPFRGLQKSDTKDVVRVHLEGFNSIFDDRGKFKLAWTDKVVDELGGIDFDPRDGMRKFAGNTVEKVENAILQATENKNAELEGDVLLDIVDGELVATEKGNRPRRRTKRT